MKRWYAHNLFEKQARNIHLDTMQWHVKIFS